MVMRNHLTLDSFILCFYNPWTPQIPERSMLQHHFCTLVSLLAPAICWLAFVARFLKELKFGFDAEPTPSKRPMLLV